jgi:hypothetical protein
VSQAAEPLAAVGRQRIVRRFTLVLVAFSLAACTHASGRARGAPPSSTPSRAHLASLGRIVAATRGQRTFQFETKVVGPPDSSGHRISFKIAGVTDRQSNRSWITDSPPGGPGHEDFIVDGARFYARNMTGWCWSNYDGGGPNSPLGVTLPHTLALLTGPHRDMRYIGEEVVRGVTTTHYRVTGSGPTVDIWTDAQDRLRRITTPYGTDIDTTDFFGLDKPVAWTSGVDKQTDTDNFVDFDKSATITIPTNADTCRVGS